MRRKAAVGLALRAPAQGMRTHTNFSSYKCALCEFHHNTYAQILDHQDPRFIASIHSDSYLRVMDTSRLEKLQKRRDQLTAQINTVKAQQRAKANKQRRRDETRRKIIWGGIVETHCSLHPDSEFAHEALHLLEKYVRPEDRHLFPFEEMRQALNVPPAPSKLGSLFKKTNSSR